MFSKACILGVCSFIFLCSPADAGDATGALSLKFLQQVAGVYRERFDNADVSGGKFKSENTLEIVPVDEQAAYVRMHLEFYNGAMEDFSGIAAFDGKHSLIYDNGDDGEDHCVVEFTWSNYFVTSGFDVSKTPGCMIYTIPRGSISGAKFKLKEKRRIRYIQRIRNSREFKKAMELYKEP